MSVVQFDTVESRQLRPARRGGEDIGQRPRKISDVGKIEIGHQLALAVHESVELAWRENFSQLGFRHRKKNRADFPVGAGDESTMSIGQDQKFPKVALWLRTPADPQKIDDLDEQSGVATARPSHRLHQFGEARDESVVTYPEQRAASNIPDPCRLDNDGARPASSEAVIPGQHLRCDVSLFSSAPGHHSRDPGALLERKGSDAHRTEPARARRLGFTGPACGRDVMLDGWIGMPHVRVDQWASEVFGPAALSSSPAM